MPIPATNTPHTYVGSGHRLPPPRPRVSAELIATLASRLTSRDRWLLEMLHEYRVLTTGQIHQLAFPSMSTTTHRLLTLWRLRAVERFRPATPTGSTPMHYVLGPAGAAVLAARHGKTTAQLGYRLDHALAISHSDKLTHLIGTNDIFTALAQHARTHAGAQLVTWWSERRCQATWGKTARPDGYGRWRDNGRQIDFFLEYDTGTEPLHRLLTKIGDYDALAHMTGITTTPVLFALPSAAREDHLHTRITTGTPLVATTTPEALHAAGGPAGPAWRPHGGTERDRWRLIDLAPGTRPQPAGGPSPEAGAR